MKRENLTAEQALAQGMRLPFALIRQLSQVTLGPVPAQPPELAQLIEARFFDGQQEIRLFRHHGTLQGVCMTPEAGDRWIERTLPVENRALGEKITVRYLLRFDEDGQCEIGTFCLIDWTEGQADG